MFIIISFFVFIFVTLPGRALPPDEHVLTPTIKIDGQEKVGSEDIKFGTKIRSIQVDQRLDTPDYFSVDLYSNVSDLDRAKSIKITNFSLTLGKIVGNFAVVKQQFRLGQQGVIMTLFAFDKAGVLKNKAWQPFITKMAQ